MSKLLLDVINYIYYVQKCQESRLVESKVLISYYNS